jgi:hypothetical protein
LSRVLVPITNEFFKIGSCFFGEKEKENRNVVEDAKKIRTSADAIFVIKYNKGIRNISDEFLTNKKTAAQYVRLENDERIEMTPNFWRPLKYHSRNNPS